MINTKRERIKVLNTLDPMGLYAVFCRSQKGNKAMFKAIHDTHAKALDVARMHAADDASMGKDDFTYYVVQIQAKVGIEAGKLVDVELK